MLSQEEVWQRLAKSEGRGSLEQTLRDCQPLSQAVPSMGLSVLWTQRGALAAS